VQEGKMRGVKQAVKGVLRATGVDIVRYPPVQPPPSFPQDFTEDDIALATKVKPLTLGGDIAIQTTASAVDVSFWGERPFESTEAGRKIGAKSLVASLQDVKSALYSVGYPKNRIHFIKGRIEDTIPKPTPERISFLRLDTCFYESTRHELIHFYPRLSPRGVLHIDDYGLWKGSRQAVDEYTHQNKLNLFFVRIGRHGARMAIKI
jgi:Macrocin-O-methyltransferase (TylF)